MRILISADMEGISGVCRWEQVAPGSAEYPMYQKLMTVEVNAAIRGAFAGGASEVIVHDGHHRGQNLLPDALDARAELSRGTSSPFCMMTGIETGVDAVFTVGYHAKSGSAPAILAHSMDDHILSYKVNGLEVGEFGLSAILAGWFEAPVLFGSGDQAFAAEAGELVPGIEIAMVKLATGYYSGICFAPEKNQAAIEAGAKAAVERFSAGNGPKPFQVSVPATLEVSYAEPFSAEKAAELPFVKRESGRTVSVFCRTVMEIYRYADMMASFKG